MLFQRPFKFPNRTGFGVNRCHRNAHFQCHPATVITRCSGYILIKGLGFLSLTRLPMKVGVAKGKEEVELDPFRQKEEITSLVTGKQKVIISAQLVSGDSSVVF